MKEIATDSRGNIIYVEDNEVGGRRYWSSSIGGGVVVWDTSLVSTEELSIAVDYEAKLAFEEIPVVPCPGCGNDWLYAQKYDKCYSCGRGITS